MDLESHWLYDASDVWRLEVSREEKEERPASYMHRQDIYIDMIY